MYPSCSSVASLAFAALKKLVSVASSPMPKKGKKQPPPAMLKQPRPAVPKKRINQLPCAEPKKKTGRLRSAIAAQPSQAAEEVKAAVEEAAAGSQDVKLPKKKKKKKRDMHEKEDQDEDTQRVSLESQNCRRTVSRTRKYASCWNLRLTCPVVAFASSDEAKAYITRQVKCSLVQRSVTMAV